MVSRDPLVIKMPLDVRSTSLSILAAVACLGTAYVAAPLIVPMVLATIVAYALDPLVRGLERVAVPRWLSAALVILLCIAGLGATAYQLSGVTADAINRLPDFTDRLRRELRTLRTGGTGPIQAIEEAADDLEAAASEAAGAPAPQARTDSEPTLHLRESIVIGYMNVIGFTGQAMMLTFLAYFQLASGDLFKHKLVQLAGPTLAKRRVTVEIIDQINLNIERFMLVIVTTNALVGGVTWLAFLWIGLPNAAAWALLGGVLNTIPYFGSAVAAAIYLIVGVLQFGSLGHAVLPPVLFVVISSLEGILFKPYLMGRVGRMNNVAVFVGLLFWGWLWGIWGLLLAFPLMMVIKTVADRVEGLRPIGALLGE